MIQFLTTGAAARAIGVHVRSLQRWVQAGHVLPDHITPGGHMRWNEARVRDELAPQVQDLLDAHPTPGN